MVQWHTYAGNITTNIKDEVDFTLTELSGTKIMMRKLHVDEPAKGRYAMILGRDLITELGLNFKWSNQIIEADDGPFKGFKSPMVDLGTYEFKDLNTEKNILE